MNIGVLSTVLCLASVASVASVASAAGGPPTLDFAVRVFGPTHVFRGYGMRLGVSVRQISERGEIITLTVEGLPDGATCSGEFWRTNQVYHQGSGVLRIVTGPDTPLGRHTLTVRAVSEKSRVERTVEYEITVDPLAPPLPKTPVASCSPIPLVDRWERQMVTYGAKHAQGELIAERGTWEGNVWYYDGQRAYYQIADYTGDPAWYGAAEKVERVYRDQYVLKYEGHVTGYRIFPHGLYEDYRRTGDELSKKAALLLARNAAYANVGGGVGTQLSRETAYCLNAYMVAEDLGAVRHPKFENALDYALGHMDQWFISKNFLQRDSEGSMPPFMVALTSEALIRYYEKTADPRVPHVVQIAADWLWDNAWIPQDESFYYRNKRPYDPAGNKLQGAPDLNLLIAPVFGWLYHLTGDPKYRERGDRIFAGGVKGAYLDGAKQFTQSYRWSFDYVQWRRDVPVPSDRQPPAIDNLRVERAGSGAAVVSWTSSEPAVAEVQYGQTPEGGDTTPRTKYLVTSHTQTVTGLAANRTHSFRVRATDASGNTATSEPVSLSGTRLPAADK